MRIRPCAFAAVTLLAACQSDLPPASLVAGVRILATRADLPYAAPGESVSLQALVADGRADPSRPLQVYWLPTPCLNPAGDAYYNCYPSFGGTFAPGVDLSSQLTAGEHLGITLPADALSSSIPHAGVSDPYGLAFVVLAACAGTLEYRPAPAGQSPLTTPFVCLDTSGAELGPSDFVFAFTRIYVYADRRNANPVIDHLTFGGAPIDPTAGLSFSHCTASDESKCATTDLDIVVPEQSWELDPGSQGPSGSTAHEAIWVDYYVTAGHVGDDAMVLFDAHSGRASSTKDAYEPPLSAGPGTLWAVVHDNRGGVSWLQVPFFGK